ncbi:hypothetical protein P3G55_20130, partial [Leptospira sp. 96542]|nr:hypothetical protein [Leptospira sp. 96542]
AVLPHQIPITFPSGVDPGVGADQESVGEFQQQVPPFGTEHTASPGRRNAARVKAVIDFLERSSRERWALEPSGS